MAKDVQLPNGTIIENVPDNIGKYGIIEMAIRKGHATAEDFGQESADVATAVDDSSFGQNLLEGTGRGMANIGRNIANIAGVEGYSDEELKESNRLDEALMDTGGGMVGSAIGETALTLPVGGAALAGVKGVTKGLQAARGVAQAARTGGVGGRLGAGQLAATGALEGAGVGALAAGPDERLSGAAWGGGAGGVMSGLGSGLRRARTGLAKTDEVAGDLMDAAAGRGIDLEVPVAQAAQRGGLSGAVRRLYGVLPYIPGSGKTMERYANTSARDFSEMIVKDAAPEGFEATLGKSGRNIQEVVTDMSKHYEDAFADTIESYKFNTKGDFLEPAFRQLEAEDLGDGAVAMAKDRLGDLLRKYADDGILDGADIGRIKSKLSTAAADAADNELGKAFKSVSRGLDDMVADQLSLGGDDAAQDLLRYNDLISKYGHFMDLEAASVKSKAPGGMFDPKEYLSVVNNRNTKQDLARGAARNQGLAEAGAQNIGKSPKSSDFIESLPGRTVAYSALGGGGTAGLPGVLAVMGGARALAGPAGQRTMLGKSAMQKELNKLLETKTGEELNRAVAALLRRGTAATVAEEQR